MSQPISATGVSRRMRENPHGDSHDTFSILFEFADGLVDLEGFSHVYIIYHFHRTGAAKLKVKPFLQDAKRGVFATRAPCRPNAIGLSLVRLVGREGRVLRIEDVDVLDGTPLLDRCAVHVRIPALGTKGSINVATAGGVVLYELLRKYRDSGRGGIIGL